MRLGMPSPYRGCSARGKRSPDTICQWRCFDSQPLRALVTAFPAGFSAALAASYGADAAQMDAWQRDGYLVPVNPS